MMKQACDNALHISVAMQLNHDGRRHMCDTVFVVPLSTCLTPPHLHCSDVICDFPLKDMLAYHKQKGAEGTILVTKVRYQRCCSGMAVVKASALWLATANLVCKRLLSRHVCMQHSKPACMFMLIMSQISCRVAQAHSNPVVNGGFHGAGQNEVIAKSA